MVTKHTVLGAAALALMAGLAQAGTLEVLVLDKDGKPMPDAVVIVSPNARGTPKKALPLSATVNQEKMQFVPNVSVVGLGAKVRFANNDAWDHHVRLTSPGANAAANTSASSAEGMSLRLEGKTEGKPASFTVLTLDKPGATGAVLLGCFIHGSMSGHVYVAESPWTVKTEANGIAVIEDVPEGAASVRVWHGIQVVEKAPQTLAVGAAPAKLTVQLDVVPRRRRG
ncbi:MAG: plastocyanin [Pseudomonadota bacterium]